MVQITTGKLFKKWFQEQFLPYLALQSVIVTDNASYHSVMLAKPPTISGNKISQGWLEKQSLVTLGTK
jgi:hypothetical protein